MAAPFDPENPDVPIKRVSGTHPIVERCNEVIDAVNLLRQRASKKLPQGGSGGSGGVQIEVDLHIDGVRHRVTLLAVGQPVPIEESESEE